MTWTHLHLVFPIAGSGRLQRQSEGISRLRPLRECRVPRVRQLAVVEEVPEPDQLVPILEEGLWGGRAGDGEEEAHARIVRASFPETITAVSHQLMLFLCYSRYLIVFLLNINPFFSSYRALSIIFFPSIPVRSNLPVFLFFHHDLTTCSLYSSFSYQSQSKYALTLLLHSPHADRSNHLFDPDDLLSIMCLTDVM